MAATITDRTLGPIVVQSGSTVKPFANVDINDPLVPSQTSPYLIGGGNGTLSVTMTAPHAYLSGANLGSLFEDTTGTFIPPGTFNPDTRTFTDQTSGGPTVPSSLGPLDILHNLQYTAPILDYGATWRVYAQIGYQPNYGAGVYDHTPVEIDIVRAPAPPVTPDPIPAPVATLTPATIGEPATPDAPATVTAPVALITPATIGEPVFRFYDPSNQDHFFTADANEAAHIQGGTSGLIFEGSVFHGVPGTDANAAPVYRFYEPGNNSHFYTDDVAEMKHLVASNPDLLFEGAAFSAHATMQAGDVAVQRFYEPNADVHMYSSNAGEIANLSSRSDFLQEGVAFFAKA